MKTSALSTAHGSLFNLVFGPTLRSLVFRYCMALIIIPIVLILLVTYIISNSTLRSKIDRNEDLALNQIGASVDHKLNQINVLAGGITVNRDIISALREYTYTLNTGDAELLIAADHAIQSFFVTNNAVRTIYLRSTGGRELFFGNQETSGNMARESVSLINNNAGIDRGRWLYKPKGDMLLVYLAGIKDYFKGNVELGTIVIYINSFIFSEVFDAVNSTTTDYFILGESNEYIYGAGGAGHQIDYSAIERPASFSEYRIMSFNKTPYVVLQRPVAGTGWRLVSVTPLHIYLSDLQYFRLALILTGIFTLVLAVILNIRFSQTVSRPVNKLAADMRRLSNGDFEREKTDYQEDELGYIQKRFDEMAVEIRELINRVYREETAKRNAELNALQAQINPHFLYNALNSVNCLAQIYRQKDISDIIVDLGLLLRGSLDLKEELITLSEEITYAERYLRIANMRWSNRFTLECRLPAELEKCRTPKLLLQPLVENCINHGFNETEQKGLILVSVENLENDIAISIRDNGKGLSGDRIALINRQLENQKKADFTIPAESDGNRPVSIGIYNVNARLFLRYGEKYGLVFFGNDGPGITVRLLLPKIFKKAA